MGSWLFSVGVRIFGGGLIFDGLLFMKRSTFAGASWRQLVVCVRVEYARTHVRKLTHAFSRVHTRTFMRTCVRRKEA